MARILIVEDNPLQSRAIADYLHEAGWLAECVADAEAAWQRLQSPGIDLVLSDLQLPGINGFELCRRIKGTTALEEMPVVLLTRWSDPLNILRGLEAGADGFVSKGQPPAAIVERVGRVLEQAQQSSSAASSSEERPARVVFLQSEFELSNDRQQLLNVLLAGFQDVAQINEQFEDEVRHRTAAEHRASELHELYHSLVETLPVRIARKDIHGRFTFANALYLRGIGATLDQIVGKTDFDVYPRAWAERSRLSDRAAHASNKTVESVEGMADPDGQLRYFNMLKSPVRDQYNAIIGTQEVLWDVTDRTVAQQEARRYAERLQQSNEELEQFAYVASHDLKEPLRMVAAYTQLLAEEFRGQLGAEADRYIDFALGGAKRMQRLIDDLLAFSRIGRCDEEYSLVEMQDVVQEVLENLSLSIDKEQAVVTVDDVLPRVQGNHTRLVQLMQNLLSNALKFRGAAEPRIHVTCTADEGYWHLVVADNGIGLDARHAERIFQVFQRLHTADEFEGTGIGLAVVKKIVERHGGRIWVESQPGAGARFHFTLPQEPGVETALEEVLHA